MIMESSWSRIPSWDPRCPCWHPHVNPLGTRSGLLDTASSPGLRPIAGHPKAEDSCDLGTPRTGCGYRDHGKTEAGRRVSAWTPGT